MTEQPTAPLLTCPTCGEPLALTMVWRLLPAPPGDGAAFRLEHRRRDGRSYSVYLAPPDTATVD
jgi:hypothetical protein